MAEIHLVRRLSMMVYRISRAKRNSCGMDEYFDEVVGHCSLCSEICLPERGTLNVCVLNCQGFYRRMMETHHHHEQQVSEDAGPASLFSEQNIFIPLTILFSILLLVGVALSIILIHRRQRGSVCGKSPKDEWTEAELRGSALETAGGNASEKDWLKTVDLERGGGLRDSGRSSEATEALSSLCSAENDIHQMHLQQHQQQRTAITVI